MKWGTAIAILAVAVMVAVCVRLGFWQLSRLGEKRALNAAMRQALEAPPVEIAGAPPPADAVRGRRVRVRGAYDESRQVLLSGRAMAGSPGVHVVTPLVLDGGAAVLVDRGWLFSADAATARPQRHPEPGAREVLGFAEPLHHGLGGPRVRRIVDDSLALHSARWLDADSLASRFPYPLAGFSVRALPGPGVPDEPRRAPPLPHDESMHLGYAVQWFSFAAILAGGSIVVALNRRKRGDTRAPDRVAPFPR